METKKKITKQPNKMLVITSGMIVADIIAPNLPKIAEPGEMLHLDTDISLRNGGHPGNVVIDLAQLGIDPKNLGTIIALGKDVFGEFLKNKVESYGIKTFIQWTKRHTSTDVVLVVKGQDRRFHISPGANLELNSDFLKRVLKKNQPKVFCSRPGYSGIDLEIGEIFKGMKNAFKFLDVCRPYKKPWAYILPAISQVDALHCNEKEAMNITSKPSAKEAIKDLKKRVKKFLFITEGAKGAKLIIGDKEISQPSFKVKWIDPTGCGDAFCAGIIYKLIKWDKFADFDDKELTELLLFAQAAGAAASLEPGCTTGVTSDKVNQLIKAQGKKIFSKTKSLTLWR